jgi:hypothetical protein
MELVTERCVLAPSTQKRRGPEGPLGETVVVFGLRSTDFGHNQLVAP